MKKTIIVFMMVFLCKLINAQNLLTEIVINGDISYLDNLLKLEQINNFSLAELRILRNTIYARYGYKFVSDDLATHFSQFSWYEGNATSVENVLTSTDWKNIRLIKLLEEYYPTKIDYIFNFRHNGIYKLDNDFILTPIYTNNRDTHWWGSYYYYIQVDDFFIFHSTQNHELLYDYKTNYIIDDLDRYINYGVIEDIISIEIKSRKTAIVNCLNEINWGHGRRQRIIVPITINYENDRFSDEIIGTTIYNTQQEVVRIDRNEFNYQGTTMIYSNGIVNLMESWYPKYVKEYVKEHLFTAFDKNIIVILENSYPWIIEGRIYRGDPEHLSIGVIYNNIYNVYFMMVINYGYAYR